ncbi:MAG: Hpt domain-containing protein [Phycisphaeraceae bacterium]|nr:Hpt domain-containing protein [Phycisphaeraceae bacterium]
MSAGKQAEPLRSRFAGDAEMVELVEEFVQELPRRADALRGLLRASQFDELRRAAHQLKGAAGGYGFPTISDSAAGVERTLHSGVDTAQIAVLQRQVDELIDLCGRAVAA